MTITKRRRNVIRRLIVRHEINLIKNKIMEEFKDDTPQFIELGVSKWLASNLKNVGIEKPT